MWRPHGIGHQCKSISSSPNLYLALNKTSYFACHKKESTTELGTNVSQYQVHSFAQSVHIYLWTKQHILHPTKRKVHFCTKVVLGKSKVFTQQQFRSFNIETHLNMYVKLTLSPQFNVFKKLYFGNSKSFPLEAHVFQWRSIFMEEKQMCTFYIHFLNISFLWQNFGLWMTFVPWIEIYFHTHHREQSVHIVEQTHFLLAKYSLNGILFLEFWFIFRQTTMFTFLCKHKFSSTEAFSRWHLLFSECFYAHK